MGLWLVLLVLLPALALGYLGVRGAEGHAERLRQRIRDELAALAPRFQAEARALIEADARHAQAVVEDLAQRVARRLPFEPSGKTLRDLRAFGGAGVAWEPTFTGRALALTLDEPYLDLRVLDANEHVLLPATTGPEGDEPAASEAERLWRDLRAQALAAAFGRGDVAAARAVWADARARVADAAWQVRADVEAALLEGALTTAPAAAEAACRALEASWSPAALEALGRPWVLLLLRGAGAGGRAGQALRDLEAAGASTTCRSPSRNDCGFTTSRARSGVAHAAPTRRPTSARLRSRAGSGSSCAAAGPTPRGDVSPRRS